MPGEHDLARMLASLDVQQRPGLFVHHQPPQPLQEALGTDHVPTILDRLRRADGVRNFAPTSEDPSHRHKPSSPAVIRVIVVAIANASDS